VTSPGRHAVGRGRRARAQGLLALALVVLLIPGRAGAWIYPEHRDIMAEALGLLPPEEQALFAELWAAARTGQEPRYCTTVVDGDGRAKPSCIDLAAWPAIAGDHSCSPDQFVEKTLTSDWILKVARVAAETKVGLGKASNRDQTLNEWAISNLKLQFVDPEYASRAGANNGHFLITRTSDDARAYLRRIFAPDTEPNALALYVYYHLGAMALAQGWAAADAAARPELARRILATEAFAVHFLEDSFAAGHVAGSWGDVAERKGTHDYYSEFGLDTSTWDGSHLVMLGDAHMRPEDLARTGKMVAQSLSQLAASLRAGTPEAAAAAKVSPEAGIGAAGFDSCTATKQPAGTVTAETVTVVLPLASQTPIPGRGEKDVHVPHFRQEIGPFVGFAGDLTGGVAFGGFQSTSAAPRAYATGEVGFRLGVGLEALTGSTGAGQAFLGFGFHYETPQNDASPNSPFDAAGLPLVPARRGITFRLRVPFYLVPFDLLLAAPILIWASPTTLTNMGIVAASGGLIPWHYSFNTPIGAFQFLLGREVGVTLFGYFGDRVENAAIAAPGATVPVGGSLAFVSYRSLQVDLPSFEYRPLRDFATKQALTFSVIIGWGIDFPNQVRYTSKLTLPAATGPTPTLGTAWLFYVRLHFDARYYF
jgi:hypothetical protein